MVTSSGPVGVLGLLRELQRVAGDKTTTAAPTMLLLGSLFWTSSNGSSTLHHVMMIYSSQKLLTGSAHTSRPWPSPAHQTMLLSFLFAANWLLESSPFGLCDSSHVHFHVAPLLWGWPLNSFTVLFAYFLRFGLYQIVKACLVQRSCLVESIIHSKWWLDFSLYIL